MTIRMPRNSGSEIWRNIVIEDKLTPAETLDKTFGPQLVYVKAPSKEQGQNLPPSDGLQFFGHIAIDGASQQMTVTLKDVDDRSLWAKTLDPKLG